MKYMVIMALLGSSKAAIIDIKRSLCGDDNKIVEQVAAALESETSTKDEFTKAGTNMSTFETKQLALHTTWYDASNKYEQSKEAADKTAMEEAYANFNSEAMRLEESNIYKAYDDALANKK